MKVLNKIIEKQRDLKGTAPVTMAFFGDSVTQGSFELYKTGEKSFMPEVRVEEGYHTKLRDILQMLYPSVPINMIYAGISGDNAPDGLARVERDVCAFNPDLTVVCFGLNDSCGGSDRLDVYKDALKGIFQKLKKNGSEIIFMTPNLIPDQVSDEVSDEYTREVYESIITSTALEEYIEGAKEVCKEENITVCDCYKIWESLKKNEVNTTRLLSNRINHPTEKMHWLFAFKLAETIFLSED